MIRTALQTELDWINAKYDEIGFVQSTRSDTIVVAEVDGERAGLGRLISIEPSTVELGGIVVFEAFRRRGLAAEIVAELVERSAIFERVYCLPFAHLTQFYGRFGFRTLEPKDNAPPQEISDKLTWCSRTYADETRLLLRERSS